MSVEDIKLTKGDFLWWVEMASGEGYAIPNPVPKVCCGYLDNALPNGMCVLTVEGWQQALHMNKLYATYADAAAAALLAKEKGGRSSSA